MKVIVFLILLSVSSASLAQSGLERFENLVGKWEGTGEGFGNAQSKITAEYTWLMKKQYIEIKHWSEFDPTPQNPEGEIHEDLGIISFDKARNVVVFRQYHNEGFFNEYVLNESKSNAEILVFETERIENFVPGGRARFTIKIFSGKEIETTFDVGFPGKEMACYGANHLIKQ